MINAGGIINVSLEVQPSGYDETRAMELIDRIGDNLAQVYAISKRDDIPTNEAAARLAEERLAAGRQPS